MRDSPIPNPRFTGLFIPAEVLSIPDLSPNEIMLLAWIDALYSEEFGGCFASNSYFSQKLRVKEDTITRMISKLKEKKLIEQVGFDGRTRIIIALKENWFNQKNDQFEEPEADSDLNPSQTRKKILGSTGFKSDPSYIDSKVENKVESNTPYSPSSAGADAAADAADVCVSSKKSLNKKPKAKEFPAEVQEVAAKLIGVMQQHSKTFRPPDNPAFLEAAALLLEQNQDIPYILRVLEWACKDKIISPDGQWKGWSRNIYSRPTSKRKEYGITKFCTCWLAQIDEAFKAKHDCKLTPGADLSACEATFADWHARSL